MSQLQRGLLRDSRRVAVVRGEETRGTRGGWWEKGWLVT